MKKKSKPKVNLLLDCYQGKDKTQNSEVNFTGKKYSLLAQNRIHVRYFQIFKP